MSMWQFVCFFFFLMIRRPPRSTLFPYTTSSDLLRPVRVLGARVQRGQLSRRELGHRARRVGEDRKSTRLNSSHANISYAVFCLKKKNYISRSHRHTTEPHTHHSLAYRLLLDNLN